MFRIVFHKVFIIHDKLCRQGLFYFNVYGTGTISIIYEDYYKYDKYQKGDLRMYTGNYECLELFVKPDEGKKGSVLLKNVKESTTETKELKHIYGNWIKFPVSRNTEYEISTQDCTITFAYLSECENIMENGICVLDTTDNYKEMNKEEFLRFIDTPYREQYHFSPVVNWNNDPNGLCWFKGYYHLFYQLNPFGQEWNNMYWGHAASKDLMHWTHLPVALEPQEEILDNLAIKGGAFSGSALPMGDEVYFYLTRHIGPQDDGWDTVQYQTMTKSSDMIHLEPEKEIIREKPEGTNYDFRDPKAIKIGKKYYIVLGACIDEKGTFLLYESEDAENWKYRCPLITEETKIRTIECPDFFPLDDKYVAMGAWMSHYDEYGRFQQCRYYVGDWNGDAMDVHTQQWVDFGSNCYAAQSFQHEDRRILIGWISDFYGEHIATEPGAYGSMTLPRELHVKNEHVYTKPVEEVYTLLGDTVYESTGSEIKVGSISDNRYYASVSFEETGDFNILLGQDGDKSISLTAEGGKVFFKMTGVKSDKVQFVSSVEKCRNAEIFVDGRTIEVYLNDGEDAGTRLFYNSSSQGIFCLNSDKEAQVKICEMKSIWK